MRRVSAFLLVLLLAATGHADSSGLRQQADAFQRSVRQAYHQARGRGRHDVLTGTSLSRMHSSDLLYATEKARAALINFRRGQPMDPYIHRAADLLGLSRSGIAAFTAHHGDRKLQARVEAVLRGALDPRGTVPQAVGLVESIYNVQLWKQMGDRNKERSAMVRASRQARKLGVDLQRLMQIPVHAESGHAGFRMRQGQPRDGALSRYGGRKPGGHPQWWTGRPAAYLDLVYRRLPQLIERRFAEFKKSGRTETLRVWHAGYEDTSQTLFLAAGLDEAMARLQRSRPEMRRFLDQLKVEIVATDHLQKPARRGRNFRFAETEKHVQLKSPMLLAEFGRAEAGKAKREIHQLEAQLPARLAEPRREQMKQLAEAGKVGQIMGRVLDLGPRMQGVRRKTEQWSAGQAELSPSYRLRDRRWRIEDRVNGGVINAGARKRSIRFQLSDITKEAPGRNMDLVVCTNVLTYLHTYGGSNEQLPQALSQISRSLKRGGALLVDGATTHQVLKGDQSAFLGRMARGNREVWVSTFEGSIDPIDQVSR